MVFGKWGHTDQTQFMIRGLKKPTKADVETCPCQGWVGFPHSVMLRVLHQSGRCPCLPVFFGAVIVASTLFWVQLFSCGRGAGGCSPSAVLVPAKSCRDWCRSRGTSAAAVPYGQGPGVSAGKQIAGSRLKPSSCMGCSFSRRKELAKCWESPPGLLLFGTAPCASKLTQPPFAVWPCASVHNSAACCPSVSKQHTALLGAWKWSACFGFGQE